MKTFNALLSVSVFVLLLISQALAAPPGGHLNINQVIVDDPNNPTAITIVGEDLLFGASGPSVTLGEYLDPLIIVGTPTDQVIVALLPENIIPGDYLLTVATGDGQSQNDEYDLTIGAVGPEGPQGEQGIQGIQGEQGLQGIQGTRGEPGPPGNDGQNGLPGSIGQDGTSCSATQGTGQATVQCTDGTSATVYDGEVGARGPVGAQGPSGIVRFYRKSVTNTIPANTSMTTKASCDPGDFAISGGVWHADRDIRIGGFADWGHAVAEIRGSEYDTRDWLWGVQNLSSTPKEIMVQVTCADRG